MVGAVVVAGGKVVGEGWHRKPGEPHAEAMALEKAGPAARGGTLFVNLEPCDHTGRTPPCTRAIIDAGIAHVSAACLDPHPLVDGKGFETLRKAGVKVTVGVLGREAEELNRAFIHFSKTGTPYTTIKLASTLDGRIAAPDGDSKWITGKKARRAVHRLRAQVDAVMVGVGTVTADNPMLTARGVGRKIQPWRIVLDPALRTPIDSRILDRDMADSTMLVIGEDITQKRCSLYQEKGVQLLKLPVAEGVVPWKNLAVPLVKMGILHVLVEGGGKTAARLLAGGAVNRLELFLSPRILGASGIPAVGNMGALSLDDASVLSFRRVRRIGEDVQITADLQVRDLCSQE
jgi:diaminohydroxyphosphoribosylaminopyrimidine deaminase/5-amino-6-(5-phosphoribosylamino)uracil reductase